VKQQHACAVCHQDVYLGRHDGGARSQHQPLSQDAGSQPGVCQQVLMHCWLPLQVFLYVSTQKRVLGLAVVEPLRHAYRVMAPAGRALTLLRAAVHYGVIS
jgi:hypothetical protein